MKTGINTVREVTVGAKKRRPLQDLKANNIVSGMISGLLAMTGPPAIILEAANAGQFTPAQTVSWMFAVYFFGGIFSIAFPLLYKIPITGAHSISGVAFLATITPFYSHQELIGAYFITGLIIYIVGVSGAFSKIMGWFPKEIISAMLAGMITVYVVRLISSVHELPVVGIPALLSYFIFIRWIKRIPAVLGAVLVAGTAVFLTQNITIISMESLSIYPALYKPEFTVIGLLTIAIPLVLLILSNDAAPGIGALKSTEYNPPIKKIVSASGIFTMITAFFGGQSANVAGMMTAICAGEESGPKQKRYMASVVSGFIILLFGVFAWWIVPFIKALPVSFISMLAGFALIGVLGSSLQMSFSDQRFRLSSTFAFVITLSGVSFYYISAPILALVMGSAIYKLIEKKEAEAS